MSWDLALSIGTMEWWLQTEEVQAQYLNSKVNPMNLTDTEWYREVIAQVCIAITTSSICLQ